MRAIDLAEMLRKLLDVKINKCRKEMLDTYMQIEVERIQAQIMVYQWVQTRIQDIVIENESKDTKITFIYVDNFLQGKPDYITSTFSPWNSYSPTISTGLFSAYQVTGIMSFV
jgi:hypothetical protein